MVSKLPAEILYEIIVQVFVDYVDEYIMERQQPASPDEQNALVCLLQTSTQLRAITQKVVRKGMRIAVDSRGRCGQSQGTISWELGTDHYITVHLDSKSLHRQGWSTSESTAKRSWKRPLRTFTI